MCIPALCVHVHLLFQKELDHIQFSCSGSHVQRGLHAIGTRVQIKASLHHPLGHLEIVHTKVDRRLAVCVAKVHHLSILGQARVEHLDVSIQRRMQKLPAQTPKLHRGAFFLFSPSDPFHAVSWFCVCVVLLWVGGVG
jgi:hypothetical protein